MKVKQIKIETVSPKKYKVDYDYGIVYEFPFDALDQSGKRLGTIEWHLEPFTEYCRREKRYYINKLWLWATQTVDKRYNGKIFEIPCFTEMIKGNPEGNFSTKKDEEGFLQRVWDLKPYSDNGNYVLTAYPRHEHNILRIEAGSSIFIEPKFLTKVKLSN